MAIDPRAALDRFIAALEAHYAAVTSRRTDDDPQVDDAYDVLADAFEVYDEALLHEHGESTPFFLEDEDLGDDEGDEDDDDLEDDEDDYDLDDHLDEDED
ncbi:primosomal protein [Cellulomonas sp. NPDC089187]|uniref:primosomal protein n=1 Tax=Cellulomonas sp. NPDC089187 TaxID=3154970 RepID=UPI00341628B0